MRSNGQYVLVRYGCLAGHCFQLRGTLLLTAGVSVLGLALTPGPARADRVSLEEVPSARHTSAVPLRVTDLASVP